MEIVTGVFGLTPTLKGEGDKLGLLFGQGHLLLFE
jgi:hypothetical protein